MSDSNLSRNMLPAFTQTEATSITDLANQYVERYFLDGDPSAEQWKYKYDSVSMRLLDAVGGPSFVSTNARYEWNEFSRLETGTVLEVGVNSSAEYLKLEDPGIVNVGFDLTSVATNEHMLVLEVDLDSGLAGGTNVKVRRGQYGSVATAHTAGEAFVASGSWMGEKDIPREGMGTGPGLSQYNLVSLYGRTYSVTKMREGMVIKGGWGQLERERFFNIYALRREVAFATLFGPRWVQDGGDRGIIYRTGGISHFVKSNVYQLGTDGTRHSWEVINGVARNIFAADASGPIKIALCGRNAFMAYKRLARELGKDSPIAEDAVKLGLDDFIIETDHGPIRMVLAKDDLPINRNYQLGDHMFILDPEHIRKGTVAGFENEVLATDVQERLQQFTVRTDAVVGSMALGVMFEDTHAIVKGAPAHFLNRSNMLN